MAKLGSKAGWSGNYCHKLTAAVSLSPGDENEVDTDDDGPYNAAHTTITFADGVAVAGDYVELLCDGTNWYATGQTNADGGITLA